MGPLMQMKCVAEPEVATNTCGYCGIERPLTWFRFRDRTSDKRRCQCRECANVYESQRRKLLRRKRIGNFLSQVNMHKAEPSRVEALTIAMIKRFEGLGNLVN